MRSWRLTSLQHARARNDVPADVSRKITVLVFNRVGPRAGEVLRVTLFVLDRCRGLRGPPVPQEPVIRPEIDLRRLPKPSPSMSSVYWDTRCRGSAGVPTFTLAVTDPCRWRPERCQRYRMRSRCRRQVSWGVRNERAIVLAVGEAVAIGIGGSGQRRRVTTCSSEELIATYGHVVWPGIPSPSASQMGSDVLGFRTVSRRRHMRQGGSRYRRYRSHAGCEGTP